MNKSITIHYSWFQWMENIKLGHTTKKKKICYFYFVFIKTKIDDSRILSFNLWFEKETVNMNNKKIKKIFSKLVLKY